MKLIVSWKRKGEGEDDGDREKKVEQEEENGEEVEKDRGESRGKRKGVQWRDEGASNWCETGDKVGQCGTKIFLVGSRN